MGTNPLYAPDIKLRRAGQGRGTCDTAAPLETEPLVAHYTIREMAQEFQVTIRALRFYEDRGLLHPRRNGNVRRYDDRDRLRLKMILKGKQLGFTLAEIDEILAGRDEEYGKGELEMELTAAQIAAQINHLEQQRGHIEGAIAALRKAQQRLPELPPRGVSRAD